MGENFRAFFVFPHRYEMLRTRDGSIRGSIKLIESLKTRKSKGKKSKDGKGEDWTWKELADMVKYTKVRDIFRNTVELG